MKIRNGFVSNSSSSSFICEVCGDTFETWDEGISHFNLVMCMDYDHLFCEIHRVNPKLDGDDHETFTMYEQENDDDRIDSVHCPICQMKEIPRSMIGEYAVKKLGTNYDALKDEMRDIFATYDEFHNYLFDTGTEFGIELTAQIMVQAPNKELAYKKAREVVMKNPVKLDVTHCEKL